MRGGDSIRSGFGRERSIGTQFFFPKNEPGRLPRLDPVLAPPMILSTALDGDGIYLSLKRRRDKEDTHHTNES
jgi:hypothetical protein